MNYNDEINKVKRILEIFFTKPSMMMDSQKAGQGASLAQITQLSEANSDRSPLDWQKALLFVPHLFRKLLGLFFEPAKTRPYGLKQFAGFYEKRPSNL